ncbi:MAG: glycosyltransferase [Flavobacteriaceae bacterium]
MKLNICHIIDSLNVGGLEVLAVNIYNSDYPKNHVPYLIVTREEGDLKKRIKDLSRYSFINRNGLLDIKAIIRALRFVDKNNINILHAHGTSYFFGSILKLLRPKLKLIWHDHYGNSEFIDDRNYFIISICSRVFNHVISVNDLLNEKNRLKLKSNKFSYLSNFVSHQTNGRNSSKISIQRGFKIVCIAAGRPQKNHFLQIEMIHELVKRTSVHLFLYGEFLDKTYLKQLKKFISDLHLAENIHFMGSTDNVQNEIKQYDLGILSSSSEGLPLAILDYGMAGLPVVATNVGQLSDVIPSDDYGKLTSLVKEDFINQVLFMINNEDYRKKVALNLHSHVIQNFSEQSFVENLEGVYAVQ